MMTIANVESCKMSPLHKCCVRSKESLEGGTKLELRKKPKKARR